MRSWQVFIAAIAGGLVVSAGGIALSDIDQYFGRSLSVATIKMLGQRDRAELAAAFILAFAVLSVAMSILTFRVDLSRLGKIYSRVSLNASEVPAGSLAIEDAARKIGDAIIVDGITGKRKHDIGLDGQRVMRLEIQRAYVRRLFLLQAATLALGVAYHILFASAGESSKSILVEFLQWSVFASVIVVLSGGALLWMDQLADWAITEIVTNLRYATENDHRPNLTDGVSYTWNQIEPALTKHLERIEIANEGLYQRVAEFLISNRLLRQNKMETADDVANLEKMLRQFVGDIRPIVERIKSEQEGLQAAVRKQGLELTSIGKRQSDAVTKLEMIDSTLNRLARVVPNAPQQVEVRSDLKGKVQSGTVVRNLENLLSDLAGKNKPPE